MTKAKLTRIPKRVLACVLAVLMVLSCLTMLPFTGFAANLNHAELQSPAVVQDGSMYYAFGSNNVLYRSGNMADWEEIDGYVDGDGLAEITELFGATVTKSDVKSPEVISYDNGGTWHLYLSLLSGSRSMIVVGTSGQIEGPYTGFSKVLETGFDRGDSTDVLQSYFATSYGSTAMPAAVSSWGKGTCYYYSNILGLRYTWYTEQLPTAYAPSITKDSDGDYWMAYGYRNGGIWLQKINAETGLIDFTWSGDNWANAGGRNGAYHYTVAGSYDSANASAQRLDPYFGQLIAHTTEAGDTDTTSSSVSRAGEEAELYCANGKLYLQVTYGGSDNGDGYNVRSYVQGNSISANGVAMFDFVDMNGESAVDNADASLITAESGRTGLKLIGDYGFPGVNPTDDDSSAYYTAPGASSVSADENGITFFNYQVKTNNATNGTALNTTAELRSHILLHNVNGDPLVTPFEYTGSSDASLYTAAFEKEYTVSEDGSAPQVAGQYYVTMTGSETTTSKQSLTGLTLTEGHLVSGAISGTWQFEDITIDEQTYPNGVVITDESTGKEYHGAFLVQTVEDSDSLKGLTQTMTFTLVGDNQTIWGVWYDEYTPANENNAAAGLEISSAIYTGGALELNAQTNGQLGLRYGNYITGFKFAGIDYSTYLMIDDDYEITDVVDYDHQDDSGITVYYVAPDGDENTYSDIIDALYRNRTLDAAENAEAGESTSIDPGTNSDSIEQLVSMLQDKAAEAKAQGKSLYILAGYLDSSTYGRRTHMDRDKGSITLYVYYKETGTNATFTERVYSHVYQQPVSANLSASVYESSLYLAHFNRYENSVFLRAEGSYSADSYYPGTNTIRNSNINDEGSKKFASYGIYLYYNPSLYTDNPVFVVSDLSYFHGQTTSLLTDTITRLQFNDPYRNENTNADVVSSYEMTEGDDDPREDNGHAPTKIAGPRAEYYIDLSSTDTSSISAYISDDGEINIPLYYSSVPISTSEVSYYQATDKTFDYGGTTEFRYRAGLFSYDQYWSEGTSNPLGPIGLYGTEAGYPFAADFDDVRAMYDAGGFTNSNNTSAGANVSITASLDELLNTTQSYGDADTNDYNFYVRSKSETTSAVIRSDNLRMATDMEYGIYVTDKSYVRDFYDAITAGKYATGYTYYSWEAYRDATRLVADYLNNYMELADSVYDTDGSYDPDGATEKERAAAYEAWLSEKDHTVDSVLADEAILDEMLTEFSDQVQDVLCFLLNDAVERLFAYNYFSDYMAAYDTYVMLTNYADYTASSWKKYLSWKNEMIEVNGKSLGISFADLAGYTYASVDDPDVTPVDPTAVAPSIYNPFYPDSEYDNYSWKIINDEFFSDYGVSAKDVFLAATEQIEQAIAVLRNKADYTALDSAMAEADTYVGTETIVSDYSGNNEGNAEDAGISSTDLVNTGIFDIDRSTVAALASSMDQGTDYVQGNDGTYYTISAMAAFDKVYNSVWELTGEYTDEEYANLVSQASVIANALKPSSEEGQYNPDYYYSNLVRDDQQRYADNADGTQSTAYSEVQAKIYEKAAIMQQLLAIMQENSITKDAYGQYETFDYLIDVVSSIDFNAYTQEGQALLWQELYDLLVDGGVYLVNQQLFYNGEGVEDSGALVDLLYDGDGTYYTGLNSNNVDAATTELMELLSTLDTEQDPETGDWYKKHFNINVNVSIYNENGTDYTKPSVTDTIEYAYGDTVEIDVDKYTEQAGLAPYDPSSMYIHSWSIDSASGTQYLHNAGKVLQFTASEEATVNVSVSLMPTPSDEVPENTVNVTVNSMIAHADRVDLAMNLSESEFSNYSISVAEDDTLTITGPDGFTQTFTPYKVSFYEFAGWRYNGLYDLFEVGQQYNLADYVKDGKVTISPYYKVQDLDLEITVNGDAIDDLEFRKFDSWVEFDADEFADMDGEFAAWLLKDTDANGKWDGTYTIASYDQEFSFYASDDEAYVQANKVTNDEGSIHYVVFGDETVYDAASQLRPVSDSEDAIDEIDTTSLYYRLSNGLRDAWSHISEYDTESETISLYSHYTSSETIPDNARVIETGGLFVYLSGEPSEAQLETFDDRLVVGTSGINQFIATQNSSSGQSEGQYVVSVVIPENRQGHGYYALMRNYVRYSYDLTDPTTGETETFYSYAYSDLQYAPVG